MVSRIQKYGDGLKVQEGYEYVDGDSVNVDTISVDLSSWVPSKISLDNIDTSTAKPGQILWINEYGALEYTDPSMIILVGDEKLREEYPSLQIAHDRVAEALEEYEMVKKLVQDYD